MLAKDFFYLALACAFAKLNMDSYVHVSVMIYQV